MKTSQPFVPGARVWWHVSKHISRGCYTIVTKTFSNGDFQTAATAKSRIKRVEAKKGAACDAAGNVDVYVLPDSPALSKRLEAIYKRRFNKAFAAKR